MSTPRRMGFWLFLALGALASVVLVAAASRRSGTYWADFRDAAGEWVNPNGSGFLVVDVTGTPSAGKPLRSGDQRFGIGPVPWAPSLQEEDLVIQEVPLNDAGSVPIPEADPVWTEVTVQEGDTLSSLAAKSGLAAADIVRANEIKNPDALQEGQVLYLPRTVSDVLATLAHVRKLRHQEDQVRRRAEPLSVTYYVVKEGDTLWSIANAFDLDVNSLFGANRFRDANVLKPGSTLRVPNQDGVFVKVKEGQTLAQVADQYGAYPEAIRAANGLAEGTLPQAGAELFVPGAKPLAFAEGKDGEGAVGRRVGSVRALIWPVVGRINSPFGWRRDPFGGRRDYHTGLDIKAPTGRSVQAAAPGRVVYSGWMSGYGKTVVLEHRDGSASLYAHCSALTVRVGQSVRQGQSIARVGSTGRSTGSHLHFEIRIGGTPVNPLKLLR